MRHLELLKYKGHSAFYVYFSFVKVHIVSLLTIIDAAIFCQVHKRSYVTRV